MKYAAPMSCDNSPQNIVALDLDNDEHYVLTPKPVLRASPVLFEPKQVQSDINPNTFTAQEAGIHSNAELTNFWNRFLIREQSDPSQHFYFFGKAISYDVLATS